jgi:molybdopterin-containing oxidoreductase family membrane subunit
MFGHNGLTALVPWFWASMVGLVGSFVMLLIPWVRKDYDLLPWICGVAFLSIWIEKGMGLMIPGSIPTPIGEFTEYSPSWVEIVNSLGNWAIGFIALTLLVKGAIGILLADISLARRKARATERAATRGSVEEAGYADA